MTLQNFAQTCIIQSKNLFGKYPWLCVTLVTFCSHGSCSDETELTTKKADSHISDIIRENNTQSISETNTATPLKILIPDRMENAETAFDSSCEEYCARKALEDNETSLDLDDYIANLDLYTNSIIPNAQTELDVIVSKHPISDNSVINAFGGLSFLASTRVLIAEQLQSLKKLGIYASTDTTDRSQRAKLNKAAQKYMATIDMISRTRWGSFVSPIDLSIDVRIGQHIVPVTLANLTTEALEISAVNISDKYSAIEALDKIDSAIILVDHKISALHGENFRFRCALQILSAQCTAEYLIIMSQSIHNANASATQSVTDTISPSERTMLHAEYKAYLDCIKMIETTSDEKEGRVMRPFDALKCEGELSFFDQLKETSISTKDLARQAVEKLATVSDQYRAQLQRLLANLADDSGSASTQETGL